MLAALNTPRQIVEILPAFPESPASLPDGSHAARNEAFGLYEAPLQGRPYRIQLRPGAAWTAILQGRVGAPGSLRLLVQLRGGEVVAIERAPVVLQMLFARLSAILTAGSLILVVMMTICYLQLVRPIDRLARATATLAPDGQGADLPVQGPEEIRRLVRCLNDMRDRIRDLVEGRTRELAAIAHDLRTYLTRLRLRAEFITPDRERDAAVRDLEEMGGLLDDTLLFASQLHRSTRSPPASADVAAEVAQFVAVRAAAGQDVTLRARPATSSLVPCPPLALRRMLANLTDNALRYGDAAWISLEDDEAGVCIVVQDDGPGVPEHLIDTLTEPFMRLEPSRGRETGGAGLGLSIVKLLAEAHGGRLSIGPGSPRGLRATIWLPTLRTTSRCA